MEVGKMYSEFSGEALEAQRIMQESAEVISKAEDKTVELSHEIQQLSSTELRQLASKEYALNGETPLRTQYLELAEVKDHSEHVGSLSQEVGPGHSTNSEKHETMKTEQDIESKMNAGKEISFGKYITACEQGCIRKADGIRHMSIIGHA